MDGFSRNPGDSPERCVTASSGQGLIFTVKGEKLQDSRYATSRIPSRYLACLPQVDRTCEDGIGAQVRDAWERGNSSESPADFPLIR